MKFNVLVGHYLDIVMPLFPLGHGDYKIYSRKPVLQSGLAKFESHEYLSGSNEEAIWVALWID